MTYVLLGESGPCCVGDAIWRRAVALAERYGWSPRGTVREPGWPGCYVAPCGQMVASRDAAEMALALEDLLDDIPDFASDARGGASLLEGLGGPGKADLRRLIAHLRSGSFMIYANCGRHADRRSADAT
ncbi:MAG: hypothetical protein HMLKMBBP_03203 [Planctomycetes bacterium]|nr:hypothetical protein [Planctomycetota bacterium]